MNITFNTKLPILYDFLCVIVAKYNNTNFNEEYSKSDLTVSKEVTAAIDSIWNNLDINVPGAALFFSNNNENPCFLYSKYYKQLHLINSIDVLIDLAFNSSIVKLQLDLIKFYDNNENSDQYYTELLQNTELLYSYIDSLDIPLICKWELSGMINNPEAILVPLRQFCHRVKRKLKNVYKQNTEFIKTFKITMSMKIKNNPEHFLDKELSKIFKVPLVCDEFNFIISYSFINQFLATSYTEGHTKVIILGTGYADIINNEANDQAYFNFEMFLKAFSDKRRIEIFKLLLEKEMYVGEIAKSLNLILSTTSYHLEKLSSARIIYCRTEGKKLYYRADQKFVVDEFRHIADVIESNKYKKGLFYENTIES